MTEGERIAALEVRHDGLRRDLEKLDASVTWVWRAVATALMGLIFQLVEGQI